MTCKLGVASGVLLAAFSAIGSASPATSSNPVSEAVDVELVNVEVRVVDALGNPVQGLSAEDFRLQVAGEPRQPSHFSWIDLQSAGSDKKRTLEGVGSSTQQRLVIYIDTTFLRPGELATFGPALCRFLDRALPPTVSVMLAVADPQLRIVRGFEGERNDLVESIQQLSRAVGSDRFETEHSQVQRQFEEVLGRAASGALPVVPGAQAESVLTQVGGLAAALQGELERAAARVEFLVQMLQGLPGRREILFITGRPPAHAGADLLTAWLAEMGQNRVFSQSSDPGPGGTEASEDTVSNDLQSSSVFGSRATSIADLNAPELLRRMGRRAAAAGVTIHAVDLSSTARSGSLLGTSAAGQGSTAMTRRASIHQGTKDSRLLQSVASVTGGEVLPGPDPSTSLSTFSTRQQTHYSLAFAPEHPLDGEPREISLRLAEPDPELSMHYRRFYRAHNRDQRAALATTSSLLANQTENPLNVVVEVATRGSDGDPSTLLAEITLVLPFSRIALRPEGKHHLGQLSVFSLWGEIHRQTSPIRKGIVPIRIANRDMLTALGRSVEYSWEMEIPAGAAHIAVGVRDDLSDLLSTVIAPTRDEP